MKLIIFAAVPRWYSFRGDRLVNRLIQDGHEVAAVVVQHVPSGPLFREILSRFGPLLLFRKSFDRVCRLASWSKTVTATAGKRSAQVPVYAVKNHNTPECVELVRSMSPDLVILRGSGIVKDTILGVPRIGTLNAHWGLLPEYRGVDVTEWAALRGHPIGVTIHFVDAGVDTGPILLWQEIATEPGDDTGTLREKSSKIGIDLIATAVRKLEQGTLVPISQDLNAGKQYFTMHYRLRVLANRHLKGSWDGNNHP
jgi:folate-dependent phosphoribosylglycinamide formyltransferase PurN